MRFLGVILLCSATPSIESYFNSLTGKYNLIRLNTRFGQPAKISVVSNTHLFNEYTINQTKLVLSNGGQVIYYFNRRGYATYVFCELCGIKQLCTCGSHLVYHQVKKILLCHRCNRKFPIDCCSSCGVNALKFQGTGIERVSTLLASSLLPLKPNIELLSSDTTEKTENIRQILDKMHNKFIDILLGTSMVVKGHDFPAVALVVVLDFQGGGLDYRVGENLFQTLVQVAGRAGRHGGNAEVIIQTAKSHYLIDALKGGNYEEFLTLELAGRKKWFLPPFSKLLRIEIIRTIPNIRHLVDTIYGPLGFVKFATNRKMIVAKLSMEKFIANRQLLEIALKGYRVDVDPYDFYA